MSSPFPCPPDTMAIVFSCDFKYSALYQYDIAMNKMVSSHLLSILVQLCNQHRMLHSYAHAYKCDIVKPRIHGANHYNN